MTKVILIAVAVSFLPLTAYGQETDTRPGVAVMAFANGGSFGPTAQDLSLLGIGLQQMLLTELAQNSNWRIVERDILNDVMAEQDLAVADRVSPGTAADVGKLVGARYMITGAFTDVAETLRIDVRIVDVESGEILKSREVRDHRDNLYRLLVELASGVMEDVDLPPLAAATLEARGARNIPLEAVTLYATAQALEDDGEHDRAVQLYTQLVDRFPDMVEAAEALRVVRRH